MVRDISLPCNQCIGCRLDRARDWSLRIGHECKLHEKNWFATLTYAPEHLPLNESLTYEHMQSFYKRARRVLGKFRHFTVGEYGELLSRPHYHAIWFGMAIPDLRRFGGSEGRETYVSETINRLWGKGHVLMGTVTPQSANYVARYSLKKINGQLAEAHYGAKSPEFCHMSSKPGIGAGWFAKYHQDVTTHDYVIRDGVKNPVPRYYDKLFKRQGGELDVTKMGRSERAATRFSDNTPERLQARETVAKARSNLTKRHQ